MQNSASKVFRKDTQSLHRDTQRLNSAKLCETSAKLRVITNKF